MKKCIIPGTFDPITKGHANIIKRASNLFDEVIVAVAESAGKKPMFSLKKRCQLVEVSCEKFGNVAVETFNGLIVDFAKEHGVKYLVKGLRTSTDFEYESLMATQNHKLDSNIETLFLMTIPKYTYLTSTFVRELMSFGGDISPYLPNEAFKLL